MHFSIIAITGTFAGIAAAAQCNIGGGDAQTNHAKTCADLLRGKNGQSCSADPSSGACPPQICHQGSARVYGLSNNGQHQSASCASVAAAVDAIIAQCLNGGKGNGAENTGENGNLRIQLHD